LSLAYVVVLLLMGCYAGETVSEGSGGGAWRGEEVPPDHVLPPPDPGVLHSSLLIEGETATLTARDMPEGSVVVFAMSTVGPGTTCPAELGGDCVDLAGPVLPLGVAVADLTGVARHTFTVPEPPRLSTLAVQAVTLGTPNTISDMIELPIYTTATAPGPSCDIADLDLQWPLPGDDASDWVTNMYVDLDRQVGATMDYTGGSRTYDGHYGVDIDAPTFRDMDDETLPILAAASGTVIATEEGEFDRNTSCESYDWNYVWIEYDNGFNAWYGHLKQDSVTVLPGDTVVAGQQIGVIGSSGCSTAPHLHYELWDCDWYNIDPFLDELWSLPPIYDTELGLLEGMTRIGGFATWEDLVDPGDDMISAPTSSLAGVGMSMAGGTSGDVITLQVRRPDETLWVDWDNELTAAYRHHFWYWNFYHDLNQGTWTANIDIDGETVWSSSWEVD